MIATTHRREGPRPTVSTSGPQRQLDQQSPPAVWGETVHLHGVDDTSVHLVLPPERGRELVELGWAEPHQYEDWGTEFLIYGPRDRDELEVILEVIQESLAWSRAGS